MTASELPDAEILAYQLSEAVGDERGDAAQEYLAAFVDELFVLEPGLAEHFADSVLADLTEEVVRREDPKYSHAVIELVKNIQSD